MRKMKKLQNINKSEKEKNREICKVVNLKYATCEYTGTREECEKFLEEYSWLYEDDDIGVYEM